MDKYVISLINSPNRHKNWKVEGLTFFDAITKEDCAFHDFSKDISRAFYGRDLTYGEIGCSMSHFSLISKYAKRDEGNITILEDDAITEPDFIDCINEISNLRDDTPSIYLLGYAKTSKKHRNIRHFKYPLSRKFNVGSFVFGDSSQNQCGAVGYVINQSAAQIIANSKHVFWVADEWRVIKNLGINVYYPLNPVVYEDLVTPSTTGNIVHSTESILKFPFKNLYMILKNQVKMFLRNN